MKRIVFLSLAIFLAMALLAPATFHPRKLEASPNAADFEIAKKLSVKGVPLMGPPSRGPKPHASTGVIGKEVRGTRYAIIIGISDYPGPYDIWEGGYDLHYAADDAKAMNQALIDVYGFEASNIHLLLDSTASRETILNKIADLKGRVSGDDEVIFFYSGHGAKSLPKPVPAHGGGKVGIVVWGRENPADPTNPYLEVIWDKELREAFRQFKTDRFVFVFDTCFSAGMFDLGDKGKIVAAATTQTGLAAEAFPGEFPYHGLFTYFLVELGMNAGAADFNPPDGRVTIEEAFDFARFNLEYMSETVPVLWQIPTIKDNFTGDLLP